MTKNARSIVREAGTALAVLAIYVLTLLLPMHQAAGTQRDLAGLGFETVGNWSICVEIAKSVEDGEPAPAALKCPATGVGKYEFAAIVPVALPLPVPAVVGTLAELPEPLAPRAGIYRHFGQSRAPPVTV